MANTGIKNVLTLRKYVDGVATNEVKLNVAGEADYIPPYEDLVDCPTSPLGPTTTTTTQAICVPSLEAVACGYSSSSSSEACLQNNVVIAYKTDIWLGASTKVYSTSDGCNVASGFYAPLPGEEGDGSVFQVDQSGTVIGSSACNVTTQPPSVYNVGYRTSSGYPISSFACDTTSLSLYASTPLFSNVGVGTRIYSDSFGTPLQGGNLWFGIASSPTGATRSILIDNSGIVTNDAVCEVQATTTPSPASINVYARTPLEDLNATIQYSVNGGAYQNSGSGSVDSICSYLLTIGGLSVNDNVVIRIIQTGVPGALPINANKTTSCPTSVAGASSTYSYGALSAGVNNLAVIIDNIPELYTLDLGFGPSIAENPALLACERAEFGPLTEVYVDSNDIQSITRFYDDSTGTSFSPSTGYYSDGTYAIEWNGTAVVDEVFCAAISTTTSDPSQDLFSAYDANASTGWTSDTNACSAPGEDITRVRYHISNSLTVVVGTPVYTDNSLTSPLIGGSLWYHYYEGGSITPTSVLQINNSGVITSISSC